MPEIAVKWQNSAIPCENYINAGNLCGGFYGIVTIWRKGLAFWKKECYNVSMYMCRVCFLGGIPQKHDLPRCTPDAFRT